VAALIFHLLPYSGTCKFDPTSFKKHQNRPSHGDHVAQLNYIIPPYTIEQLANVMPDDIGKCSVSFPKQA
jgi:hypothetical protein